MKKGNKSGEPSMFWYRVAKVCSWALSAVWFKRRFIRNEIKGKKGPFVIIANHQAALDFVNLIGATREHISFVISNSFYNTMPIKSLFDKAGMIPKQQFQTALYDLNRMRSVIEHGGILALYPAGLMCEDGLSTPIPVATYKFLKWLKADIYMAKATGSYFVMPKWSRRKRPGRTYLDIYKLFDKDELEALELSEIKERTDGALLFDAYREQEAQMIKYKGVSDIEGLENVLYACPHCKSEFSVHVKNTDTVYCDECGFEERCDEYGFLHKTSEVGEEIRYVSDWARSIYEELGEKIKGVSSSVSLATDFHMINYAEHKFVPVGEGTVTLEGEHVILKGTVNAEPLDLTVSTAQYASLPFSPGRYFEIQHADDIYRCVLKDSRWVMKFVNLVKLLYEQNAAMQELRQ